MATIHSPRSSPATVHKHLQNLEAKGMIRRNWNHSRSVELTSEAQASPLITVNLLGSVAAGSPIEAIENPEPVEVPRELLGSGENYVLRVRGDSMIEDQICDGDLVVIEGRKEARNGETVVALIDGTEATLKRSVCVMTQEVMYPP